MGDKYVSSAKPGIWEQKMSIFWIVYMIKILYQNVKSEHRFNLSMIRERPVINVNKIDTSEY